MVVAYAGKAVEYADVETIFERPAHPYTQALYHSIPHLTETKKRRLAVISGIVPNPLQFPLGLPLSSPLHPRQGLSAARKNRSWIEIGAGHKVRCFMYSAEAGELFWS